MADSKPVPGIDIEAQIKEWEEDVTDDEEVQERRKTPLSEFEDIAVLPVRDKEGKEAPKKDTLDGLGGIWSF